VNNEYMSNNTVKFGKLCRAYRAKLGLNMIQAAEKIGVTQSTITKIEQGEQPASFEFIEKSIAVYQIRERKEEMEFLLSYLSSAKKLEIPVDRLGPVRKEWLAALCTLGNINLKDPEGWGDLLQWMSEFEKKLQSYKPDSVYLDDPLWLSL
jgi:transcriptional regulator with XRE-family HTH domain